MNMITKNFLRNSADIVDICEKRGVFEPREGALAHGSIFPFESKFSTWRNCNMDDEIIQMIFADADFDPDLKDLYDFIQIQRYEIGDWICPHVDNYDITKLHLITLTTSFADGLVTENENHQLVRIPDEAGSYLNFPYNAWHWVSPVIDHTRYSLVVGE